MSLILCIETSVKSCSVAVVKNGISLSCIEEHAASFLHAEKLTLFIQQAIDEAQIGFNELDAIAVSGGPGSFTGLRIGISVAKGLCFGLDIPLIEINSLEVLYLSYQSIDTQSNYDWYIPMIDARRMEVYTSIYSSSGMLEKPSHSLIITPSSFNKIEGKLVVFGDGADKLEEIEFENKSITVVLHQRPSANYMGKLAQDKFEQKQFVNLAYYEPFYLKEFGETTQILD